jgi:hypothetical protein
MGRRRHELRANSRLKSSEYSVPVLGLIFPRYVGHQILNEIPRTRLRGELTAPVRRQSSVAIPRSRWP